MAAVIQGSALFARCFLAFESFIVAPKRYALEKALEARPAR